MADLKGKSAVVTGGSRGIGLAIAEGLLARGVRVVITGRDESHLADAKARLSRRRGAKIQTMVADVRDHAQVEAVMAHAVSAFGGLDILINNAGVGVFSPVADQSIDKWRETIDTNLTGVFNCCHAAIPHLRARGQSWIINVSSLAGKNPFAGGAAYCASKAGLNAFSEALMQEVRYEGIRVSYVMPGSVRTEFAGSHDGAGTEWKLAAEDVAQVVVDLLQHDPRSLPSRVEIRPSQPRKAQK